MTQTVNTAMREAFATVSVAKGQKIEGSAELILSALKRKVGVTKRQTMWSVQRGKNRV
ncbi:hypothetical protein [Dyella silvatica]|uniref:hypothetical protein n=1 Tax=Dyella silvatica TaxID=2992128 RepID=UPI00225623DF|nr:hypothetical protein [Dyella silvatica]